MTMGVFHQVPTKLIQNAFGFHDITGPLRDWTRLNQVILMLRTNKDIMNYLDK